MECRVLHWMTRVGVYHEGWRDIQDQRAWVWVCEWVYTGRRHDMYRVLVRVLVVGIAGQRRDNAQGPGFWHISGGIDVTLLFVGPWSLPLFPAPLDL